MATSRRLSSVLIVSLLLIVSCGGGNHYSAIPVKLDSISISAQATTVPLGGTSQLTAFGNYSNGVSQQLDGVAWGSSDPSIVAISASGILSTKSQGDAIITATFIVTIASLKLTVGPPILSSLSISPSSLSLPLGLTQPLIAIGMMTDGVVPTDLPVIWTSSNSAVASVENGLLISKGQGTATITARSGTVSASAAVTVMPPAISSIDIVPTNPIIEVGAQQQLAAIAFYTNGTSADITSVATWSSTSTSVATLDSSTQGKFDGATWGRAQITASLDQVSGQTVLTVRKLSNFLYVLTSEGEPPIQSLKTYTAMTDGSMQETGTKSVSPAVGQFVLAGSRFVFVDPDANGAIESFQINRETGELTTLASFTPAPGRRDHLIADPSGKWLYGFQGSSKVFPAYIHVLSIDQTTGALSDTGLSYPIDGEQLPDSYHAMTFAQQQYFPVLYIAGGGCRVYGPAIVPCASLNAYSMDVDSGELGHMGPFRTTSPTVALAVSDDGSFLWVSLNVYQSATYQVSYFNGRPEFIRDNWRPYYEGYDYSADKPIKVIVPFEEDFYAGHLSNLLWVKPTPDRTYFAWEAQLKSFPMADNIQDIAASRTYRMLFVAHNSGLSAVSVDETGQSNLTNTIDVSSPVQVIAIERTDE
jgi:hypothetical protein